MVRENRIFLQTGYLQGCYEGSQEVQNMQGFFVAFFGSMGFLWVMVLWTIVKDHGWNKGA